MNDNVGIWVDHKKAVIVFASATPVTARTLQSHVGAHAHFSGSQDGGGEKKYEERFSNALDHFYDDVIKELRHPKAILIFGPGEAKGQLKARLTHAIAMAGITVDVETTDTMTDPQIIARVKEHYGQAR